MKMLCHGAHLFFAERDAFTDSTLCLQFPFEGVLLLNGEKSYPTKEGRVRIPREQLYEGENFLFLRTKERLFTCESLIKEGSVLRPSDLPIEKLLVSLLEENGQLTRALYAVTDRITELEKKGTPRLFS